MDAFSRLFTLPENLYSSGAPVMIAAGTLLRENKTDRVLAQLKFRNIENRVVSSVTVKLYPLDTSGNRLCDTDFTYTGLSAARGSEFGQKTPVFFTDTSASSYSASVTEVIFSDNSVWSGPSEPWASLGRSKLLTDCFDADFAQYYTAASVGKYKYVYNNTGELWLCMCGTWNRASEPSCSHCHSLASDLERQDICAMQQKFREEQQKRAESENERRTYIRSKKIKNILIFSAFLVLLIIATIIVIVVSRSP